MCCASDAGWEQLSRYEEGRDIGACVEDKLGDGEQRHHPSRVAEVRNASPYSVRPSHYHAAPKLLLLPANQVREEDSDIESRQVTGDLDDDVTDGGVPESKKRGGSCTVTNAREYNGLVQVNAVVGDVAN